MPGPRPGSSDLGWVAFDPTNGICADDAYVRVACGLDYRDAAPVAGARRVAAPSNSTVEVRGQRGARRRRSRNRRTDRGGRTRMTYCLGMLLDAGLIMIADTRTNAGVDDISSYRKLHCLADAPDRCIYAASAGNLSTTQTVISLLREGLPDRRGRASCMRTIAEPTIDVPRRPAGRRGGADRQRDGRQGARLDQDQRRRRRSCSAAGSATAPPALFLIYSAGNFIECKPDVPFFQIGETKYGRPILDRDDRPCDRRSPRR